MKIDKTQLCPLYDQYSNEENRLTHALLHTIGSSEYIFTEFIRNIVGIKSFYKSGIFEISTQKKPKGYGDKDKKPDQIKSVPDAWIINEKNDFGIAIEVKGKKNSLRIGQLKSHSKLVNKYKNSFILSITPDNNLPKIVSDLKQDSEMNVVPIWTPWGDIYRLFKTLFMNTSNKNAKDSFLLKSILEYLEGRMDVLGFQGIPFNKDNGYDNRIAKEILKNEMDELQPYVEGIYEELVKRRPAITLLKKSGVWDCFGNAKGFTNDLHITLGISEESHNIALVVPNSSKNAWKRLKEIFSTEAYQDELISILANLRKTVPCIYAEFVQRHFIARKHGVEDGKLFFNLDVIGKSFSNKKSIAKISSIWFPAFQEAIINKKNLNGQVAFITKYFYKNTKGIDQTKFLETVKATLKNYKPLYDYLKSD